MSGAGDSPASLERAKRELAAGHLLAANGFPAEAVSRAYFAAYHAAEVALATLDIRRRSHSALISAFGELVVRPGTFDAGRGRALQSLFVQRNAADYTGPDATAEDAALALGEAERFIAAIQVWLDARGAR